MWLPKVTTLHGCTRHRRGVHRHGAGEEYTGVYSAPVYSSSPLGSLYNRGTPERKKHTPVWRRGVQCTRQRGRSTHQRGGSTQPWHTGHEEDDGDGARTKEAASTPMRFGDADMVGNDRAWVYRSTPACTPPRRCSPRPRGRTGHRRWGWQIRRR